MLMETISSIAKRLNVTNGRIYQIIKEIPADKQPKKDAKGKYNFTKESVEAIESYYNSVSSPKTDNESDLVKQLRADLEDAKAEIKAKNNQIDKFQQLLDQQQQLNLSTNRQNEKLLGTTTNNPLSQDDIPLKSDDTDVLKPTEGNYKGVDTKTPKRGLFGWLRR
jgi:chromosome segregation ATPase